MGWTHLTLFPEMRKLSQKLGEFCSDGPRLYSEDAVVDPFGTAKGIVVRGPARSISGILRYDRPSSIDEESANHFERRTHPSFRNVVESTSSRHDVGFRCIIAEENWKPSTQSVKGIRQHHTQFVDSSHQNSDEVRLPVEIGTVVADRMRTNLVTNLRESYDANPIPVSSIPKTGVVLDTPRSSPSNLNEPTDEKFDVFLSYNTADTMSIEPVVKELTTRGLTVWRDTVQLTTGKDLSATIQRAIRNARCVLVLVSQNGLSPWQQFEIESHEISRSSEDGRELVEFAIPVLMPGAPAPSELKSDWSAKRRLDFRKGLGDVELEQLFDVIMEKVRISRTRDEA